jgi:hypothetical protein
MDMGHWEQFQHGHRKQSVRAGVELRGTMRKIILVFLLMLASAAGAFAQSTTVSGTITDAGSQTWNNGTYQFTLIPNPLYPTSVYTWTGGALNRVITGSLSGSGTYSQSVPSNSAITPAGSKWVLQVTPNATSQSFPTAATTITGGTQTLNATPPAILISWSIPPGPAISAYSDSEIGGTLVPGSEYFNTTTLLTRVWNGSSWSNQGAGSGFSCPGATNGELLYDNAGACAGAPSITTDGAGNLTVGGEVITGEILANASVGSALALTCSPAPCTVQFGTNGQSVTNAFTGSAASFTTSSGVTVGSPTGGLEGLGTINATGLFVNGVAVSTGGGSPAFSAITSGTNTAAAMLVGTGASLNVTGSGTINATSLGGTAAASYALLASPTFTGTPAAPTASAGTNTTQLATTAFVTAAVTATGCPTGTANLIQKTNGTACVASSITDNGTTVSTSELVTLSGNGASGVSALLGNGTLFTGGSGTNTLPYWYINQGAAVTTWLTTGTLLGMNSPSGCTICNFLDFHENGGNSVFSVSANAGTLTSTGAGIFGGNLQLGTANALLFGSNSAITSPTNGTLRLTNAGATSFTRLDFGGTTSSFVALCTSGTTATICAADGTAVAFLGNGTQVVASLPAAAAGNKGWQIAVSDSTTVAVEGQTCVGSGTVTALAFSNGTVWKCF